MLPVGSESEMSPTAKPSRRWLRLVVQAGFLISAVLVGLHFHRFIVALNDPNIRAFPDRPEGAAAWLPISSLMSLLHLIKSGVADRVHPAGLVIFTLTVTTALLMRRGFCSWVCPVGTLSEYAHKAGKRLMGFNLRMPIWLDIPLRLVRYGLLGFFLYYILPMSAEALYAFIDSPYNRVVDAKMYLLFADMSPFMLYVLMGLTLLSVLFKNFWCRYLCPYGALLGLVSFLSPVGIRRDEDACIGCGKCGKACPNRVPVQRKRRVRSVECTACFSCVSACPKEGALAMRPVWSKRKIPLPLYGAILVGLFVLVPQGARAMGYWQSDTPDHRYYLFYTNILKISHPTTSGPARPRPAMPPSIRRNPHSGARRLSLPAPVGRNVDPVAAAPPAD